MSGSLLSISQHDSLTEAASNLTSRIPPLLRRLRDLENEEAKLDAQARQLLGKLPITNTKDSPSKPVVSTPVSKLRTQSPKSTIDRGTSRTTPPIDPSIHLLPDLAKQNIERVCRKFRDACESFSIDGVVRVGDVGQKQTQRKVVLGGR